MKTDATVNQIKTSYGHAFLNLSDWGFGGICAWTAVGILPTYIMRQKYNIFLVQFADQKCADEWIKECESRYDAIEKQEG